MEEINIIEDLEKLEGINPSVPRLVAVGFIACTIAETLKSHQVNIWWDGYDVITLNGKRMGYNRFTTLVRDAIEALYPTRYDFQTNSFLVSTRKSLELKLLDAKKSEEEMQGLQPLQGLVEAYVHSEL